MAWRARYFLIGGVALITAVGPIDWQFLGGRGEVLKSDGGPIVTVMDFGPSFPLDPLPSGWRHRKFWTRSPMTMASASRAGCRACASRREACDGGDLGQSAKPGTINTSAAFRTLSPMPATIGSAAGSTRGSISSASMPRSGRMPHPRTWSMSPCSAIATTAHRQHQLLRLCSARTAVRFWRPGALGARPGVGHLKEAAVALLKDRILSSRLPLSLGVMTEVEDSLRPQPSEPWPAAGASPF